MIEEAPDLTKFPLFQEALAYREMQEKLEQDYHGRWVVIHGEEKVGVDYDSYEDAAEAARGMGLDVLSCLIRQVGAGTAIFLS